MAVYYITSLLNSLMELQICPFSVTGVAKSAFSFLTLYLKL